MAVYLQTRKSDSKHEKDLTDIHYWLEDRRGATW